MPVRQYPLKDFYEFLVKYPYYGTDTWQHEMVSSFGDVPEKEYLDFIKDQFDMAEKRSTRLGHFEERWAQDIKAEDGKELPQSHISPSFRKNRDRKNPDH